MQKIYLEPLNKDEMILIGDSPSRNDHDRGGWGSPRRIRREDTSFIINTVSKSFEPQNRISKQKPMMV